MTDENFKIAALNVAKELMLKMLDPCSSGNTKFYDDKSQLDPGKVAKECRKIYLVLSGEDDSDKPTSLEKEA